MIKKLISKSLQALGYTLVKSKKSGGLPPDVDDPEFLKIYSDCSPFSYTSIEPLFHLYTSVKYIAAMKIPGHIVECGVWKGGSMMLAAMTLLREKENGRELWLYDTFEGMSEPGPEDIDFRGQDAKAILDKTKKNQEKNYWCYSTLEETKTNLYRTGYPQAQIKFIKGKVEDTIPGHIPDQISILRLDTDWYESTYHELQHLFPRLAKGGVLIIDDYGHWKGARKATDQYFKENNIKILLNRIDYSVRAGIKNG